MSNNKIKLLQALWADIEEADASSGEDGVRKVFYEHWGRVR